MSKNVIIIGAGGHAKVVADVAIKSGWNVLGFLDDRPNTQSILSFPILGRVSDSFRFLSESQFFVAIGDNNTRKYISEKFNLPWATLVHPSAQIGVDVNIDKGTVVMANAVINPSTNIGQHCIINTGAVIEHDNQIADYVHISPHATLCGTVSIGVLSHVGAGATIKNNVTVTDRCSLGAGTVVVKKIDIPGTYVGVPAKQQV